MKKIIASLAMIALVGMLAVGATWAWFTDQEIETGNTLAAGRVDIDIRGGQYYTGLPVTLSDMEPGQWYGPYEVQIYNQNTPLSTMPVKYRFYDQFGSETVPSFYNKLNVKVGHTYPVASPPNWCDTALVWSGQLQNLYIDSPTYSITASTGSLGVNITHVYHLCFQLDTSAGNIYQGASAAFDLIFDATQVGNPGWSQ